MKPFTEAWKRRHPKAVQWAWFGLLWCGGLAAACALAAPVKLLFYFLK